MVIDYLGHSGFLVETEKALMLFDYFRGDLSVIEGKPQDKPLFVFASHAHPDHFNPQIFSLAGGGRTVRYLLSHDVRRKASPPPEADVTFLAANAEYEIGGLGRVKTLRSTDQGVAFFVDAGSETVYHAGDLHWWAWEGEPEVWLAAQERDYRREIEKLAGERIDAAFVVVDDRLGENYALGASLFLSLCKPANILPMHFWEDSGVVGRFAILPDTIASGARVPDTAHETHWEI
ncbi:MAG: MBL fold metallo-hydrolase [Clostridia bacterium]|nr:MBL fold metallo-hydrolase [Clostridia bacterium]